MSKVTETEFLKHFVEKEYENGDDRYSSELEDCIHKEYRKRIFRDPAKFVSSLVRMIEEGKLPEEIVREYSNPTLGVIVTNSETIFKYVRYVTEKYYSIKQRYFLEISKRIKTGDLHKRNANFWKGRIFEEIVYEEIEEYYKRAWLNDTSNRSRLRSQVGVYPLFRIRRLPYLPSSKRGRPSEADVLADILIIDTSKKIAIVFELKNFWVEYSGRYNIERELLKLIETPKPQKIKSMIFGSSNTSKPKLAELKYRYQVEEPPYNLTRLTYEILCETWEETLEYQFAINILKKFLKDYDSYRIVRVWLNAGEFLPGSFEAFSKFEEQYSVEVLWVQLENPILYLEDDRKFVRNALTLVLDMIYSEESDLIKAILIQDQGEIFKVSRNASI